MMMNTWWEKKGVNWKPRRGSRGRGKQARGRTVRGHGRGEREEESIEPEK